MNVRPLSILLVLFVCHSASAQSKKDPPAPDHGPVLATAMEVAPGKLKDTINLADTTNYVFRGRVIHLNRSGTVGLCFDTEHLRVAGAWVGKPVRYLANKNMGPSVEGTMLFSTRPGPGWDRDGDWADPRKGKEGPLPKDWAHYRGLYLNGDKVILSYTVGKAAVLEMPLCIEQEDRIAVTRTFQFTATDTSHTLLVCEEPDAKITLLGEEERGIVHIKSGSRSLMAVVHGSPRVAWQVVEGRLHLKVPPLPKGGTFKIFLTRAMELNNFKHFCQGEPEDLEPLIKGGVARWTKTFETKGTLGTDKGPYTQDLIALPNGNPWKASIRFSGLDFFDDGRAALCTWDGDVWIVSGLDEKLDQVTWKRFAAGLQQPLGLKIIKGVIYTAGRDQITRLHDLNDDGEADHYENFNNDAGLTLQRHEFVMDLHTDAKGNLYYCRSGHYIASKREENCCVFRLPPDGSKLEVFARGFREPNGMSIGPDGSMTVADNEGNGIPQTPLYHLREGAHYGFAPPRKMSGDDREGHFKLTQPPIVWIPKTVDGSAGGQVWAPEKWGPFGGHLLHTSYGHSKLFALLLDREGDPWQGALWTFPLRFESGIMRARFNPKDGQLYVCGLRGWGTNAVKDGQFCRIRYTGKEGCLPVGLKVVKSGLELTFSSPLEKSSVEDDQNWSGDWSGKGGKTKLSKEELPIVGTKLSPDGKTVMVTLERIHPVTNITLQYQLKAADGSSVAGTLYGTINRVP